MFFLLILISFIETENIAKRMQHTLYRCHLCEVRKGRVHTRIDTHPIANAVIYWRSENNKPVAMRTKMSTLMQSKPFKQKWIFLHVYFSSISFRLVAGEICIKSVIVIGASVFDVVAHLIVVVSRV